MSGVASTTACDGQSHEGPGSHLTDGKTETSPSHRQQEARERFCMSPFPALGLVASQLGTYSEGTHDLPNGLGLAEGWARGNRHHQGLLASVVAPDGHLENSCGRRVGEKEPGIPLNSLKPQRDPTR